MIFLLAYFEVGLLIAFFVLPVRSFFDIHGMPNHVDTLHHYIVIYFLAFLGNTFMDVYNTLIYIPSTYRYKLSHNKF